MKNFLKGVLLGISIYLTINLFSFLLTLPFFLGYYFAIGFALSGGTLSYLLKGKK